MARHAKPPGDSDEFSLQLELRQLERLSLSESQALEITRRFQEVDWVGEWPTEGAPALRLVRHLGPAGALDFMQSADLVSVRDRARLLAHLTVPWFPLCSRKGLAHGLRQHALRQRANETWLLRTGYLPATNQLLGAPNYLEDSLGNCYPGAARWILGGQVFPDHERENCKACLVAGVAADSNWVAGHEPRHQQLTRRFAFLRKGLAEELTGLREPYFRARLTALSRLAACLKQGSGGVPEDLARALADRLTGPQADTLLDLDARYGRLTERARVNARVAPVHAGGLRELLSVACHVVLESEHGFVEKLAAEVTQLRLRAPRMGAAWRHGADYLALLGTERQSALDRLLSMVLDSSEEEESLWRQTRDRFFDALDSALSWPIRFDDLLLPGHQLRALAEQLRPVLTSGGDAELELAPLTRPGLGPAWPPHGNVIELRADGWWTRFEGRVRRRIRDLRGLWYYARLIGSAEQMYCSDLEAHWKAQFRPSDEPRIDCLPEGEEERPGRDTVGSAKGQGLDVAPLDAKEAYTRVWQALRTARKALAKHDPALAEHLERHCRPGFTCQYTPPRGTEWSLVRWELAPDQEG